VFYIGPGISGTDAFLQTLQFFIRWNSFLANQDRMLNIPDGG